MTSATLRARIRDLPASVRPDPADPSGGRIPSYVVAMLVAFALNIFSGQWDRMGIPVPLDRVAFAVALVLLVRARGDVLARFRMLPVHRLMLALVLLATVSAFLHGTLIDPIGGFALLDRVIAPFALFVLAPYFFSTPSARHWFLRALALMGLYLGFMAVVSVTGPSWLLIPGYMAEPGLGIGEGRARGPSLEPVGTGLNLIVCGFASGLLVVRERGLWRLIGGAVIVLACTAVVLSQTRSIWVGAAAAVLVACLRDRRLRRWLPAFALAGVAVTFLVVVLLPDVASAMLDRLLTQRSIDDRTNTNLAALEMVRQQPLVGVGWSRFLDEVLDYVRQSDLMPVTNVDIEAHNVFLSRAAELGVLGAVLWLACVLLGPIRAMAVRTPSADLRDWQLIAVGAGVGWFVAAMLTPLSYPLPNYLTWAIAGIVLTHAATSRRDGMPAAGTAVDGAPVDGVLTPRADASARP